MSVFENEIRALKERTESNLRAFLQVELQTCFVALDRARLELSMGKVYEAEKEFEIVNRGKQVIERFLRETPGLMSEIEPKLAELKASIASLRAEIDAYPS
jgi:hypothetical protein